MFRRISYKSCTTCKGEDSNCEECKDRSEAEYEDYLDGKREEALINLRGEE